MPKFTFETKIPLPETAADLHVRLQSLFTIKDELDKEIESLIGRRTEERKPYHCVRCDHKWYSRLLHRPQKCPVCRTNKFDTPPAFTYEEKLKRKQERLAKNSYAGVRVTDFESEVTRQSHALVSGSTPDPAPSFPHSVLTRSIPEPDVAAIALTPPPAAPMSLRERLEQLKKSGPSNTVLTTDAIIEPEPVIIATDDELVEAINNGDDDAA